MGIEYYITDIESLGLSVQIHDINQISVLRISDNKQITHNIKVKHPNVYSKEALEVQGITPADLKKGLPLEDVVDSVDSFFSEDGQKNNEGRCMIAYNAPFDRKFIHAAWDSVGKVFGPNLWFCSMAFAKRYVAKHGGEKIAQAQIDALIDGIKTDKKSGKLKPKFGLNNFMTGVGLPIKTGAHNAEVDVQNTLELYKWLIASGTEYVSLIERIPHKEIKVSSQDLDVDDF